MDFAQVLQAVQTGGAIAVLLLATIGFLRGWIVPKWVFDAEAKRGEEWKTLSRDGIDAIKQAIEVVERMEGRRRDRTEKGV